MPTLDPVTLFFAIAAVAWLMTAIAYSAARAMPEQRGALHSWCWAMACAGGAFSLYYLRGHVPGWLSSGVANVLILLVPVFSDRAHSRLQNRSGPRWLLPMVVVAGSLATFGALALGWPHGQRVALVSVIGALLLGLHAMGLFRDHRSGGSRVALAGGVLSAATGIAFLLRAIGGFNAPPGPWSHEAQAGALHAVVALGGLFVLGASLLFFARVHETQRNRLVEQVQRDGLTGVYTRSAFFEHARSLLDQIAQTAQTATPDANAAAVPPRWCALVMIDIDHFKRINDTHGHPIGDLTLAHAARLIAGQARITDRVGRYGGEEFCVLLSDCQEAEATRFAEQVVANARAHGVRVGQAPSIRYTLSAGCAALPIDLRVQPVAQSLLELVERADAALYAAKRLGRDRALAASACEEADSGFTASGVGAGVLAGLVAATALELAG